MIPVKHRHDKIIIVASGSSSHSFDKMAVEEGLKWIQQ